MPSLLDLRIPASTVPANALVSVSSGKIASNAITASLLDNTLNLSSNTITLPTGAITPTALDSGSVLQCRAIRFSDSTTYAFNGSSYTSTTWYDVPGASITLTSRGANSVYLMIASLQAYHETWNTGHNITFNISGGVGDLMSSAATWNQEGNGVSYANSFNMNQVNFHSSSFAAGTSITFKVRFGCYRTGGTSFINYPGYAIASGFSVWEIKP